MSNANTPPAYRTALNIHNGATALDAEPSGDVGFVIALGSAVNQWVRFTAEITADIGTDYAEFLVWSRDAVSGVWAPDKRINGNGLFRAVKGADGDAVSETLEFTLADRVFLQYAGRTDAAVRCNSWGTTGNRAV